MSAVRHWLEAIGLGQYADAFEANDIDPELLPQIDDQVLKDIGVSSAGHRMRLRNTIAKLAPTPIAESNAANPVAAPEASASSAERRQLTLMFCDLVGSTATAAQLDPEELREVIGAYHRCVTEAVRRFDGLVAKYMGDGVLVYFGYPQAHEDDAERAYVPASMSSPRSAGSRPPPSAGSRCASASPPASWWSAISSAKAPRRSRRWSAKRPTWPRDCRRWPSRCS
jgi:hypothetical protein